MFSRLLPSCRPLASAAASASASASSPSMFKPTNSIISSIQTRSHWQEFVYVVPDKRDGTMKFEDPSLAAERMTQAERAEGIRVRFKQRYEKPTTKRKRLKNERIFKNKKRGVDELKAYIQFMKNHKEREA